MARAPEGTKRTADNQGWCTGCGRPMVLVGNTLMVMPGQPDRCATGPRVGERCRGSVTMCPECELSFDVYCPVGCGDNGLYDEDDHPVTCGVCNREQRVPCPTCRPRKLARRLGRAKNPEQWAPAPAVPPAAIESLPDYRRYLDGLDQELRVETQQVLAAAERLDKLGGTVCAGTELLTGMAVDGQTLTEGHAVSAAAMTAVAAARDLLAALGDASYAVSNARDAAQRHNAAQDAHAAGLLAQRGAYANA